MYMCVLRHSDNVQQQAKGSQSTTIQGKESNISIILSVIVSSTRSVGVRTTTGSGARIVPAGALREAYYPTKPIF